MLASIAANIIAPLPAFAISVSVTPASGTTGTHVSLTGEGFIGKLATILWDDKKLIQNVPITKSGQINYTFTIPPAAKGEHVIKVTDDSNWADIVAVATFFVTPSITMEPTWGRPSGPAIIFGNGFAPNEQKIKITWDGQPIPRVTISADSTGAWNYMFNLPYVPKGEYMIGASGEITKENEVPSILFTIGPFCKARPLSGPVGTRVNITGVGFRPGEDGLTITWDGPILDTNFVAEPNGNFNCTITVPPSIKGKHVIGVYGSSFTPKGTVPDLLFEVIPEIKLMPSSVDKGTKVKIDGTGFDAGETVVVTFDKIDTNIIALTDNMGSFSSTFEVPAAQGKEHVVIASGNKGTSAQATFITNKSNPPAPTLLNPISGAEVQVSDSVIDVIVNIFNQLGKLFNRSVVSGQKSSDSVLTTLTWSVSGDETGLQYHLQISRSSDFKFLAFSNDNITSNAYNLSKSSLPEPGTYYWRVKATNDVGLESPWSNTWKFESVPTSPLTMALSIAVLVLTIAAIVFIILTLISKRGY